MYKNEWQSKDEIAMMEKTRSSFLLFPRHWSELRTCVVCVCDDRFAFQVCVSLAFGGLADRCGS